MRNTPVEADNGAYLVLSAEQQAATATEGLVAGAIRRHGDKNVASRFDDLSQTMEPEPEAAPRIKDAKPVENLEVPELLF